MNDLFASENLLAQIFSDLSRQRDGGTIYLIEHGFPRDKIEQLLNLVSHRAGLHQFTKHAWQDFALSLSVVVTEIGYEYRGTGTDFWPLVESAIKVDIPIPQRNVISDLFRECARRFGTARPFDDAWSSAFPHLAWPVRNAMVPREVHGPLARLVREFLSQTRSLSVTRATLPGLRDLARGFGSRRLESWLQDDHLALAVIGHLVSGRTGDLGMESGFLQRLTNDLRSESEVRRLERAVRARRLAQHQGVGNLPKATYELLLDDAEARGLSARGPSLTPAELEAVKSEVAVPLSTLMVTVGARSTTLERFLCGDAVFIGRPIGDVPHPQINEIEVPDWLEAVITPAPGLLFRDEGDDGYQSQIRPTDKVTPGVPFYEVVLDGLALDEWGDGLYHFTSGTPKGNAVLARHGIHVEAEPFLEFLGGLTLRHDGSTVSQAMGRPVQAHPRTPVTILAERLDQAASIEFRLADDRWQVLPMTEGIWTLSPLDTSKVAQIDLVFREIEPPAPVSLSLQPDGIGLAEIARGAGALHLSTPITLHDVELDITFSASDGQSNTVRIRAPSSPLRIAFDRPEFSDIRTAARLWTGGGMHARLQVCATGLDTKAWALAAPEPEWKYDRSSGRWTTEGHEPRETLACDPVTSCMVFSPGAMQSAAMSSGYGLLRPAGGSDGALRSCILVEPEAGTVLDIIPQAEAGQITRVADTYGNTHGLTEGIEAYLSWCLASTGTAMGEGLRSSARRKLEDRLVAALCGDLWMKTEKSCRGLGTGFHRRLVTEAMRADLVCGTTAFSPLGDDQRHELAGYLEECFRRMLPAPDLVVIPDGEMWPEMDDAVIDAWERLSEKAVSNGAAELEFDAGNADGSWQKLVARAREAARLPELSALVLPSLRAESLERLPYESSHLDDLIAALVSSHVDVQSRSGRWITPADLRAMLYLFLAPERVMDDTEWRGRLLRFGADRFTARAVRYAALRYRAMTNVGLS
ncbi:hypothetical protein [Tropicibacter oceani]|uniref:Uncharacterized protein n=1 Tax=Tropicibacter oceani TaxID=3058420 RepID=A0ABY8QLU7_9RHOB|nr:hypothetical protein [Tropicibacter oceani]WGW05087.1 hypothetical protein QF118_05935 [Tropicibacter oceani]